MEIAFIANKVISLDFGGLFLLLRFQDNKVVEIIDIKFIQITICFPIH
jgi:hypothetical protein